jgi:acyl carrier protein
MTNLERLQKVISIELQIDKDKITQDAHLFDDLNFDSLDTVETVIALENEFDIEIADDEIDNVRTVQNILDLIDDLA